MKLVLDTNIYCDYAEGLPDTVDMIATHGEYIYIPSVVVGELTIGFMQGKASPSVLQILANLVIPTI